MSVLSKFDKIKNKKLATKIAHLYECHPLGEEALDFRLQYLSALALLTALDRDPSPNETTAFTHLAQVLGIDAADADSLLSERTEASEDDIALLFSTVRGHKQECDAAWCYLADLAWLHSMDQKLDAEETTAYTTALDFLGFIPDEAPPEQTVSSQEQNKNYQNLKQFVAIASAVVQAITDSPKEAKWAKESAWVKAMKLPQLMLTMQKQHYEDFAEIRYKTNWPSDVKHVLNAVTQKMLPLLERNSIDLTIYCNDPPERNPSWTLQLTETQDTQSKARSGIKISKWCIDEGEAFQTKENLCIFHAKSSVDNNTTKTETNVWPVFFGGKSSTRAARIQSHDIISGEIDALNAPFHGVLTKILISTNTDADVQSTLARVYKLK